MFIALNSSWSQTNLALYYLRTIVKDLGYETRIQEFTLQNQAMEILATIESCQPQVLCFSAYIWNRLYLQQLIPQVKKLFPNIILVLGGPEARIGFGPENLDYIIEGSGEQAFLALTKTGFQFLEMPEQETPLKDIPFPYLPEDRSTLKDKLLYYETSRGCPFSCIYCLSASDFRNELRFDVSNPLELKNLYRELELLAGLEPRTVKFIDRSFNLHPDLAKAIWSYVISLNCKCDFHFEIYPDLLQEADIDLLASAPEHRIRFEIGIQSTDQNINLKAGRSSDWLRSKDLIARLCKETNVRIHLDLLAGLPDQDIASIFASLDELAEVNAHEIQLGILKVLPNTPMAGIALQKDFIWQEQPPYQVLRTDNLSFPDMVLIDKMAHVLNLYFNKNDYHEELDYMLTNRKLSAIILEIIGLHEELGLLYHSVGKGDRREVMDRMVSHNKLKSEDSI